jgi:hypothetical protein
MSFPRSKNSIEKGEKSSFLQKDVTETIRPSLKAPQPRPNALAAGPQSFKLPQPRQIAEKGSPDGAQKDQAPKRQATAEVIDAEAGTFEGFNDLRRSPLPPIASPVDNSGLSTKDRINNIESGNPNLNTNFNPIVVTSPPTSPNTNL